MMAVLAAGAFFRALAAAGLIGAIACPAIVRAQARPSQAWPSWTNGRLLTKDRWGVAFAKLTIVGDTCLYATEDMAETRRLPLAEVSRIEREIGNEALRWGLIFGLVALIQVGDQFDAIEPRSARRAFVGGIVGLSTLFGIKFGSKRKVYRTVYPNISDE